LKSRNLWGWTSAPLSLVKLVLTNDLTKQDETYTMRSTQKNFWIMKLPPKGPGVSYTMTLTSDSGDKTVLKNILFGDVWICGGQSNMEMTVSSALNHTAEILDAIHYPNIRLFTVGQGTTSLLPLSELSTIEQPWSIASPSSVGGSNWTYFSATCWFFAKNLYNKYQIPLGLVSTNWGGTPIQAWSSIDALSKCNHSNDDYAINQEKRNVQNALLRSTFASSSVHANPDPTTPSVLFNAMITPFLLMRIRGTIWYQGESNVGQATFYQCALVSMIHDWRLKWQIEPLQFPFLFVQLAPYTIGDSNMALPALREAQFRAEQETISSAMVTAIDLGDPTSPLGNIHPENKQTVGQRLALAAQAIAYGEDILWQSPVLDRITVVDRYAKWILLRIYFLLTTVGAGLEWRSATCPPGIPSSECGWMQVRSSDGQWHNATVSSVDRNSIDIEADIDLAHEAIQVRYAYANWPIANLYNGLGLPALPFLYIGPD